MPRISLALALPLAISLAACVQFPELDARIPADEQTAPPPELVNVASLLARADALETGARLTAASGAGFEDRAAQLRSRAATLRGRDVIDPASRARLERGVERPAALQ